MELRGRPLLHREGSIRRFSAERCDASRSRLRLVGFSGRPRRTGWRSEGLGVDPVVRVRARRCAKRSPKTVERGRLDAREICSRRERVGGGLRHGDA
jgi:hypothetical protein